MTAPNRKVITTFSRSGIKKKKKKKHASILWYVDINMFITARLSTRGDN